MEKLDHYIDTLGNWGSLTAGEKKHLSKVIIHAALSRPLSIEELSKISAGLANSGKIHEWPTDISPSIDFSSTGGPGSLTTLLCPYFIASQNIFIPQFSVPSSIAGAIDTLGIIPDFNYKLSYNEMLTTLRKTRIAHTLNTDDLAPADLFLFNERKKRGAKNLPDLVIASLLAKRLSIGIRDVVLDVRVGPAGNFGNTTEAAILNCEKLIKIGKELGINCTCVLTNNSLSAIPSLGRLESLNLFWSIINNNSVDSWTEEHLRTNIRIAAIACSRVYGGVEKEHTMKIEKSLKSGEILALVENNLNNQGSSGKKIKQLLNQLEESRVISIKASKQGYLYSIDYNKISSLFARAYVRGKSDGFDSPLGIYIKKREGSRVELDEDIIALRANTDNLEDYSEEVARCFIIKDEFVPVSNETIYSVIK